jgi:hypothetical protein
MNYNKIIAALNLLSDTELSQLNHDIVDTIKMRRKRASNSIKFSLRVGQTVKVNHTKALGKTYTVDKINKTKVVLNQVGGLPGIQIVAPISLIETI